MSDEMVWEEPPRTGKGRSAAGAVAALLAPLRDRPGEWARLPGDYGNGMQTRIAKGMVAGVEAGEFEVTGRAVPSTNRLHLWVRYVGKANLQQVTA